MHVILTSHDHYPDQHYELGEEEIKALIELEHKYDYLDAAPQELVRALLEKGTRLQQKPIYITKYI